MYAIGFDWARAYSQGMELLEGEVVMAVVPSEVEARIAAKLVRARRYSALRESDWTQGTDSPLTEDERAAWALYRQQWRDLPAAVGFPYCPSPVPPQLPAGAAGAERAALPT